MIVGIPKEIKDNENRVGLTPAIVDALISGGHKVVIEKSAGIGSGLSDQEYLDVGATILNTADEIFGEADMIVKVKEPQAVEIARLTEKHILFTYLHLAPDKAQTEGLLNSKCAAIAYETVEDKNGRLPLLTPMSEVAGRLSIQMGAHFLEKPQGGKGVLMGGVPGVEPANVLILGGGAAGIKAAKAAVGLGARVTIFEKNLERMRYLADVFQGRLKVIMSNRHALLEYLARVDLVVGAVLVPGAAAPRVITRDMLKVIPKGSVMVDISIDQGGCFETSRPTSHSDPVYEVDGVVHYCVTNMPGAVARTSTFALTNATSDYVMKLADGGLSALKQDPGFLKGLNCYRGYMTCEPVAEEQGLKYTDMAAFM